MNPRRWSKCLGAIVGGLTLLATSARSQIIPDWSQTVPAGTSLVAGLGCMIVDPAGVTYLTATGGSSSNTDVVTVAIRQDGEVLWTSTFDGTQQWHDQARGIALGPGGRVLVCGNTPDANFYANVLVLAYDASTGKLLDSVQYSSGAGISEAGQSIVVDSAGDAYVGGSTVGDGGDGLMLKFDTNLDFVWGEPWDGAALAPYSQDSILQVLLSPAEEPVALIHGVMASNQPDYVVVKFAPLDGTVIWEATWGGNGGEYPRDFAVDPGGDVLVTGTVNHEISTIRLGGNDGALVWQETDAAAVEDAGVAVALDDAGGVYILGVSDPDGDRSNLNDNFYTVKRDALTGTFIWSHLYGSSVKYHFDDPADVIADHDGHVFVTGVTSSPPYAGDAISLMLDVATGSELDRAVVLGGSTQFLTPSMMRRDAADRVIVGAKQYDVNTGDVEVLVYRLPSQAGQDGHFVDLGYGLPGSYAPRLDGSGSLAANAAFKLSFTQLPPSSVGFLAVGLDLWYLSFKGGALLPTLDLLVVVPTGSGAVDLDSSLPSGVPSDLSIYLHGWFLDPGSNHRMCAANGLELITP